MFPHSSPEVADAFSTAALRDCATAYNAFLRDFPGYRSTSVLDVLRKTDFARLEQTGETYVDYMGGSLFPDSLIRAHTDFLRRNVMGNTHSVSNSSKLSLKCVEEARAAVLSFFDAPPEYTVVFTSNTTGALKLVGESFPFTHGSSYVLGNDSHNSVNGIRQFASERGSTVAYIESTPTGGFDVFHAKDILLCNKPVSRELAPSLFTLTAQSNITNSKNPLRIIKYAQSLGYHTLLDAAALAPTSTLSLKEHSVDAMAISFYKMFGFPTGVGALVVKKSFLVELKRPWFAGGTVEFVQAPGNIMTPSLVPHEQFEDGTLNYLTFPAITYGLRFLSEYLPFLPLRLNSLLHYLTNELSLLRHDTTGTPVVRILSQLPTQRLKLVGDQSETGSLVSCVFFYPTGEFMPHPFVEWAASKHCISLRVGCMCNPGGAAALVGVALEDMARLRVGVTRKDLKPILKVSLSVVRISLGLVSNFQDVWKVVQFVRLIGNEKARDALWIEWMESKNVVAEH